MNNALTVVLIFAVLTLAAVLLLNNRYVVIQDPKHGTLLIDNWDIQNRRIIERNRNDTWVAVDIIQGGTSVIRFEAELDAELEPPRRPAI